MSATFSPDMRHRYTLDRAWSYGSGSIAWCMLNPSTADATIDDPTIRRVIRFSQAWGFQRCRVLNLFSLRSTDPRALLVDPKEAAGDPVNLAEITASAAEHGALVCAWGVHGAIGERAREVLDALDWGAFTPFIYRVGPPTKDGHPRHPLYLRGDLKLESHR